jgi:glycosyltransferase involved in cell wall biosynthesis
VGRKRIALVVSSPMTAKVFLKHQIEQLVKLYDVTVVANWGETEPAWLPKSVHLKQMPIRREISPFADFKVLILLLMFLSRSGFSLVHSVSPKAGLLTMTAAWMTRVPTRLHTFTGQVWVTKSGIGRLLLKSLDRLISIFATSLLVDSHSQRTFLLENGVVSSAKSKVLGSGSISGVDGGRFKINPSVRTKIRVEMGAEDSTVVILFLGRLKKEKGIEELIDVFSVLQSEHENSELWLVGPDEDCLQQQLQQKPDKLAAVRWVASTEVPEHYMAAADIFCLPSYREGFGSVVIEAAACGIPAVGSDIYGLSDAIEDGVTGVLVPVKSVQPLKHALQRLVEDGSLRREMGQAAQQRALNEFSQASVTRLLLHYYETNF